MTTRAGRPHVVAPLLLVAFLRGGADGPPPQPHPHLSPTTCRFGSLPLHGRIRFVSAFPDLKAQVVSAFPDLRVQLVDAFPDRCGKWQPVRAFPDLKVQLVDAFPDVKIQFVDAFPGIP